MMRPCLLPKVGLCHLWQLNTYKSKISYQGEGFHCNSWPCLNLILYLVQVLLLARTELVAKTAMVYLFFFLCLTKHDSDSSKDWHIQFCFWNLGIGISWFNIGNFFYICSIFLTLVTMKLSLGTFPHFPTWYAPQEVIHFPQLAKLRCES